MGRFVLKILKLGKLSVLKLYLLFNNALGTCQLKEYLLF